MEKYSKDKKILFKDSDHTYTNVDTGELLTSVTTFIGQCTNEFNEEYHSNKKAIELGLTQSEVLEMWRLKTDNSCEMGTYIHSMFENFFNKLPYDKCTKWLKTYIALGAIRKYYETKIIVPIESELIVYNDHLAGQIDCIADTKKGRFIIDYKSNDKIEYNNYSKFLKGVLKPFKIPDCNYNHYSLQLSIYKVMYEKQFNDKIDGLFILYIGEKKHEFIKCVDYSEQLKTLDMFK